MLRKIQKPLKGALSLGFLLLCGAAIVNMLRAPLDTVARAADAEKAKRIEGSGATNDFRVSLDQVSGIAANGVIEPSQDEIQLASEVPGVIEEILVKEGQQVAQNEVLVRFRSRIEKAQLDATAADLRAALAREHLAQKSQTRTRNLGNSGAATAEELDRAIKEAGTESAQTQAAVARHEQAKAALDRLIVRAPSPGEILKINYRVGEYYAPNATDALIIMGDTRALRVRIELDERDLDRVSLGSTGYFIADAFGDRHFSFSLTSLGRRMGRKALKSDDPRERNDTRIREIFGVVGANDGKLLSGLRVTAYIQPTSK